MSTNVIFNNVTYPVPAVGERRWGQAVTNFLISIGNNALSKAGGNFSLTADVNFGANYGIVAKYLKSVSPNIAQSGVVRLGNTDKVVFRNFANDADIVLGVNASDQLEFNGLAFASNSDVSALSTRVTTAEGTIVTHTGQIAANTAAIGGKLDKANDTATNLTIADRVSFTEVATPATPAAGKMIFYAKADKKFYQKDSTGAESLLGGGGLTPQDVTALPTTLVNGIAYQVGQSASTTALLPVTALAATIEITDVKGTCSATNFIGITAGGTDTILFKGVAVTDRFVIRRKNATVRFNKAAGSSVWEVTYQVVTLPLQVTVDGLVYKTKRITGLTAASQGANATVAWVGIDPSKVIGVQVLVSLGVGSGIPPYWTVVAGYQYSYQVDATGLIINNLTGASANILSKSFVAFVTFID